jgi:hypothetical protein
MYINFIYAYRIQDTVTVLISADLPRACDKATIFGTYPGNIIYIMDPGVAQVFIDFFSPNQPCSEVLTPWLSSVLLKDSVHDKVEIFVNGGSIASVPIINYPEPYTFH